MALLITIILNFNFIQNLKDYGDFRNVCHLHVNLKKKDFAMFYYFQVMNTQKEAYHTEKKNPKPTPIQDHKNQTANF